MTTSAQTQQLLQELFILASGRAANTNEMTQLSALGGADGNMDQINQLIDSVIGQRAAQSGTVGMVQAIAKHGLGIVLTTAEAVSVTKQFYDAGINSWSKLFTFLAANETAAGHTLDNRGEAATYFSTQLDVAGKASLYAGSSVTAAVTTLLQNIGASATSLDNARQGLDVLAGNLTTDGIISAVVDGYVRGATVFADDNGNGALDAGEWTTTTDASGNYVLPADITAGTIIAFGGIDIMTNKAFQCVLTAPAGSTVVNPLTTLVQALLASGEAATVEHATGTIQAALGLPTNINLLSYDPLAIIADGTANANEQASALAVQTIILQVANVMTQAGNAIDTAGTTGTVTLQSSAAAVTSALATVLNEATGVVNLGNAPTLTNIITEAAQLSVQSTGGTELSTLQISQIAQITAASNTQAAAATTITELSQVAVVSQGSATDAIINGTTSGNLSTAVNAFTGTSLDNAVNAAVPALIATDVPVPVPTPIPVPVPAPTPEPFTVTVTNGVVTFGGTETGPVTITTDATTLTFIRGGITAAVTPAITDVVDRGIPAVTLSAATLATPALAAKLAENSATVGVVTSDAFAVTSNLGKIIADGVTSITLTGTEFKAVSDASALGKLTDGGVTISGTVTDIAEAATVVAGIAEIAAGGISGITLSAAQLAAPDVAARLMDNSATLGAVTTNVADVITNIAKVIANGVTSITLTDAQFSGAGGSKVALNNALANNALTVNGADTGVAIDAAGYTKALKLNGGVLADTITGGSGKDIITGGSGGDMITGGAGADNLTGGDGNDRFVFNAVFGTSSDSHVNTTVDVITDLAASDVIVAKLGNVGKFVASSPDYVVTNRWAGGSLLIFDPSGTNSDGGDVGNLRIDIRTYSATAAASQVEYDITGTSGNDTIVTGGRNDVITGGAGADTLTGGNGADTFVFTTATDTVASGFDNITDFTSGTDKLKTGVVDGATGLSQGAGFTAAGTGNLAADIAAAIAAGAVAQTPHQAYVVTITGAGAGAYVFLDASGDHVVDAGELVIALTGTSSIVLVAADFIF